MLNDWLTIGYQPVPSFLGIVTFGKILKWHKWNRNGRHAQFNDSQPNITFLEHETRSAEAE